MTYIFFSSVYICVISECIRVKIYFNLSVVLAGTPVSWQAITYNPLPYFPLKIGLRFSRNAFAAST